MKIKRKTEYFFITRDPSSREAPVFVTVSLLLAEGGLLPAAGKLAGHPHMRHAAAHFGIPAGVSTSAPHSPVAASGLPWPDPLRDLRPVDGE